MKSNIINKLEAKIYEQNLLDADDIELCTYGIKQGFMIIINFVFIIIIGLSTNLLAESIIFSIFYIFLRQYAGGYHAKTQLICCILSLLLLILTILSIKYLNLYSVGAIFILVICCLIIFAMAPIEALNKPLDQQELSIFKFRARVILIIEIAIGILLFVTSNPYFECLVTSTIAEAFMVTTGKVQLTLRRRKNL